MALEDAVFTTVQTLPMCKERHLAYATFIAARIQKNTLYLARYDNPPAILLRGGKCVRVDSTRMFIQEKEIWESTVPLYNDDMLFLMSDGVTNAGVGNEYSRNWGYEDVVTLLEEWYRPGVSAAWLMAHLADACLCLADNRPKDDITLLSMHLRERMAVNIIIGPPENPGEDHNILNMFFAKKGKHVVCGGSTAKMVSKFLKKPLAILEDSATESIPAISEIIGIDLVTEGIITLQNIPDIIDSYANNAMVLLELEKRNDGAALLSRMLIEYSTDVNIYLGNAVNEGHQEDGLGIDIASKLKLVQDIEKSLEGIGKKVKISMC